MLSGEPITVHECRERIERVEQARRECCGNRSLLCAYDDDLVQLRARLAALLPEPREPTP